MWHSTTSNLHLRRSVGAVLSLRFPGQPFRFQSLSICVKSLFGLFVLRCYVPRGLLKKIVSLIPCTRLEILSHCLSFLCLWGSAVLRSRRSLQLGLFLDRLAALGPIDSQAVKLFGPIEQIPFADLSVICRRCGIARAVDRVACQFASAPPPLILIVGQCRSPSRTRRLIASDKVGLSF